MEHAEVIYLENLSKLHACAFKYKEKKKNAL